MRALLDEHAIDYYETPPNRWGISMGAIWLTDAGDYSRARNLLDDYQAERARRVRAEYAARRRNGEAETFGTLLRNRPVEVLMCLLGAFGIVAIMMWPIWLLMS